MMKKIAYSAVAAVLLAATMIAARGPSKARAFEPQTGVAIRLTGVSLSPPDQMHQITDTASLTVTLSGVGCVIGVTTAPNQPNICDVELSSPSNTNPSPPIGPNIPLGVLVQVVSGPHQGLELPARLPFNFTQFLSMPAGHEFSFSTQAMVQYADPEREIGQDTVVASAPSLTLVFINELLSPAQPDNNEFRFLISNQAEVRWIKSGAIDTGIFVRRTPVVEQQAAAAAPEIAAPQTGTGRISPPNTGDAGLAAPRRESLVIPVALVITGSLLVLSWQATHQRRSSK